MPSPFPGMNPYLEYPNSWPNVHHRLITAISDALVPHLLPKYKVMIEERIYEILDSNSILVGIPDVLVQKTQTKTNPQTTNVAVSSPPVQPLTINLPISVQVRQGHLEIKEIATNEVVTVIEVLFPTNKKSGEGRTKYETKRQKILDSSTHFVEIDLLRNGKPMPILNNDIQSHYRILVSHSYRRPQAHLYAFNLPDIIPSFPLPLRREDPEPLVNLQELFNQVYERSGYDFFIDYSQEPIPPLTKNDALWADQLLREKGLR